jgi:hypothetical protein
MQPRCDASLAYADRLFVALKNRSRSMRRPAGPRTASSSDKRTVPISGHPTPKSHNPNYVERSIMLLVGAPAPLSAVPGPSWST